VATAHFLAAGTDASSPVLLWTVALTTAAIVGLTAHRVLGARRASTASHRLWLPGARRPRPATPPAPSI
jgi:hypothetical protein